MFLIKKVALTRALTLNIDIDYQNNNKNKGADP